MLNKCWLAKLQLIVESKARGMGEGRHGNVTGKDVNCLGLADNLPCNGHTSCRGHQLGGSQE